MLVAKNAAQKNTAQPQGAVGRRYYYRASADPLCADHPWGAAVTGKKTNERQHYLRGQAPRKVAAGGLRRVSEAALALREI